MRTLIPPHPLGDATAAARDRGWGGRGETFPFPTHRSRRQGPRTADAPRAPEIWGGGIGMGQGREQRRGGTEQPLWVGGSPLRPPSRPQPEPPGRSLPPAPGAGFV